MIKNPFQDWEANSRNTKGRLVLLMFRLACLASNNGLLVKSVCYPYLLFYQLIVSWTLGIELPLNGTVGPRLRLYHGQALVVYNRVSIGSDVTLRHCTTIGAKLVDGEYFYPTIGDRVEIGSNCILIGNINIASDTVIGAGSVVLKSTNNGDVVVGNPARQVKPKNIQEKSDA